MKIEKINEAIEFVSDAYAYDAYDWFERHPEDAIEVAQFTDVAPGCGCRLCRIAEIAELFLENFR